MLTTWLWLGYHEEGHLLQYDFEESVGCWVAMTAHAMRRALDTELARENITLRQWEVLAWIAHDGEQSQSELAEKLGIEAPTLAGVLARMERDGWLERYSCPKDRRKKRIRTSAQAQEVWNRMVECCHRVRSQSVRGLTQPELDDLKRICEQIRVNLNNAPEKEERFEAAACSD